VQSVQRDIERRELLIKAKDDVIWLDLVIPEATDKEHATFPFQIREHGVHKSKTDWICPLKKGKQLMLEYCSVDAPSVQYMNYL
jgi:hypothetical protein